MFIQETKRFGRIATINPRAVPFNAERLRAALWCNKYDTYEVLGGTKYSPDIRVAPNSTVVLRRNYPGGFGRPEDFNGLLTSARAYERELNRLRKNGIGILRHTIFVVENDPYFGIANAYTAVEQCPTKKTINVRDPLSPEIYDRALNIGAGLLKYWRDHDPHTRQIAFDEVSCLFQYSETGPLLDYDLSLEGGTFNQIEGLRAITHDIRSLHASERQEKLCTELGTAQAGLQRVYEAERQPLTAAVL